MRHVIPTTARPAYVAAATVLLSILLVGSVKGQQFGTQRVISTSADTAKAVYAADLDGDGDEDVLSGSSDEVAWYENFGAGEFGAQQVIESTEEHVNTVYAADLDGDGDQDVVATMLNSIVWYENTGGGSFSARTVIDSNGAGGLFVTDVDGDGDQDILIAQLSTDEVGWYENTGGGTFSSRTVIDGSVGRASDVHATDLNGDGIRDVVAAALDGDNVVWYENTGGGVFSTPNVITADASGARSIYTADLDGDNDEDVLYTAGFDSYETVWHENTGDGSFGGKNTISIAPNVNTVHAADLTGDGDHDVVTAAGSKFSDNVDEKISWYENTGGGTFSAENIITSDVDRASSVYTADLNGDTGEDVLSASFDDDTIAWYSNQGTDGTSPSSPTGLAATGGNSQVALDWDPNAESDLAGYNVYRSTSSFQEVTNATQVNSGPVSGESFTDTGVTNGTEYFYRVTAVDDAGNESGGSGEGSAIPQDLPPAAPTSLQATGVDEQVSLNWDANTESDLAGYNVYRSTTSFQEVVNATQVNEGLVGTSAYGDTTVTNDTEYFYRVTAVDTSGNESGGSNEASAIPRPPPVAETQDATDVTGTSAVLHGQVDPNGKQTTVVFEYFPTGQPDQSQGVVAGESPLTGTDPQSVSAPIGGLTTSTDYTFEVIAGSNSGSDAGGTRTFTTTASPPSAPTNLQAVGGSSQVSLNWDDSPDGDVIGYHVYRSTTSFQEVANATQVNSGLVETASYTDSGLANGTEYFYRVTAVDTSGTESGGSNQASATPFLEITLSRSVEVPEAGTPLDVSVSVSEGLAPTNVQLFYRQAGVPEFQSLTLDAASATTYEGTVPEGAVTERGLEYYARIATGDDTVTVPPTRPVEAPRQVPVQVAQRTADVDLGTREYTMVSVPLGLRSPGALDVLRDDLGGVDRTEWRLLRWSATAEDYVEVTQKGGGEETTAQFVPGRAYWLISRQGGSFTVEDARSVSRDSVSLTLPAEGWTQLANPYTFPVAWTDIDGAEAVNAPVAYNPESPDSLQFGVSVLSSWTGYWVFNPNDSPVQLTIPQKEASSTGQDGGVVASSSRPNPPEALFGRTPTYALQMKATFESPEQSAQNETRRDVHNVVGVSQNARSGMGLEDIAEPPPIGDHARLSIVEDDTRLAGSLRPPGKEGYAWDVEISASGKEPRPVRVQLRSFGALPADTERRLIDRDTGRPISIEDGSFTVSLTEEFPTRHLRLLLGSEEFTTSESESIQPERTDIRAVYPNPSRGAVSVDYHLKTDQEVRITVYDLLGRRVRTLVNDRRTAGHHSTRWNGRAGSAAVASGTYFVRMKTESTSVSRRIVVVR